MIINYYRITGIFFFCLLMYSSISFHDFEKENTANQTALLEVNNFEQFKHWLSKNDDYVYVINFWATWCAPCVKELPYFEKIHNDYKDKGVKVILVSLDFPKQYDSQLIPFIKKHQLKSKLIALDDPNQNKWINGVSDKWSGSIPATLIYNKSKRAFFEKEFQYKELDSIISSFK